MANLIYIEKEYPFNQDYSYIIKDKGEDKEVIHEVKLTEKQLSPFDAMGNADAMKDMTTDEVALLIFTKKEIKQIKSDFKGNDRPFNMFVGAIAAEIAIFVAGEYTKKQQEAINSNASIKQALDMRRK